MTNCWAIRQSSSGRNAVKSPDSASRPETTPAGSLNGQPQFHPGPKGLCGVDIAELATACDSTVDSLATDQSATLVPWAQFALNDLQPASPQPCANVNDFQVQDAVQLTRLTSDEAQTVIDQLSKPPKYWVLLNESGASDPATGTGRDCQSDEYYVQGRAIHRASHFLEAGRG